MVERLVALARRLRTIRRPSEAADLLEIAAALSPHGNELRQEAAEVRDDEGLEDFDREGTVLCSLITDPNEPNIRDTIDITDLVAGHQGEALGLRVQIVGDLDLEHYGSEGAEFGGLYVGSPRLEYRPRR